MKAPISPFKRKRPTLTMRMEGLEADLEHLRAMVPLIHRDIDALKAIVRRAQREQRARKGS